MDHHPIRFGILGAADIANKNTRAILLSKQCILVGLASRSVDKAKEFLTNLNLHSEVKIYTSYDDLVNSNEIDAVYIPLPTTLHLEWCTKCAISGKHILLEKPASVNSETLQQIIRICQENNVRYMDGVMFMHHPRMKSLTNILNDPFMPTVTYVNSSFSFRANKSFFESNIRALSDGDPFGCLGDLGWYCIRLGILAFNKGLDSMTDPSKLVLPTKCVCTCTKLSSDGIVPSDVHGKVYFDSDGYHRELVFDSSFLKPFRQKFEIICVKKENELSGMGDKIITCNDFVIPYYPNSASFEIETFHGTGTFAINYKTISYQFD